jgi:choline dehydrogenase-like flavoprotein
LVNNNRTLSNISKNNTFDAIVVGTGISGGWAAKELCEKGFKTLVLERGQVPREEAKNQEKQVRTGYMVNEPSIGLWMTSNILITKQNGLTGFVDISLEGDQ